MPTGARNRTALPAGNCNRAVDTEYRRYYKNAQCIISLVIYSYRSVCVCVCVCVCERERERVHVRVCVCVCVCV